MKAKENIRDVIPQTTSSVRTLMTICVACSVAAAIRPCPLEQPPTAFSLEVVLHRYTKFEVHRPSCSEDMADFWSQAAWWLWPLTFSSQNWSGMSAWHGRPSSQFWCFCDFSLSSYGPTFIRLMIWPYYLHLWRHCTCWWRASLYYIPVPSLTFVGLPLRKIRHIFCLSINQPRDLDLWPISKWGHRSTGSWASFLLIFSWLRPSILDLGSGTWETTAINALCPTLWGQEDIITQLSAVCTNETSVKQRKSRQTWSPVGYFLPWPIFVVSVVVRVQVWNVVIVRSWWVVGPSLSWSHLVPGTSSSSSSSTLASWSPRPSH